MCFKFVVGVNFHMFSMRYWKFKDPISLRTRFEEYQIIKNVVNVSKGFVILVEKAIIGIC